MNHRYNNLEWCTDCLFGRSEIEDDEFLRAGCPGKERDAAYFARKSRMRRSRLWADDVVEAFWKAMLGR